MPKIVDHEQRRWELVRALWSVVRERGVQKASIRAVAREAGWSPSSVQYYFSTQSELVLFALRAISEGAEQRLSVPDLPSDPQELAAAQFEQLLPLDTNSAVATEIWVAFLSLVLVDAEAHALNATNHLELTRLCREVLERMSAVGQIAADIDLDLEADLLHGLFDGIALHAVTVPDQMPPERVQRLLSHHLDRLRATPNAERRE